MQRANDITIGAFRAALATLRDGNDAGRARRATSNAAYDGPGGAGKNGPMGFGKYTAFPHGSITPQRSAKATSCCSMVAATSTAPVGITRTTDLRKTQPAAD